MASRTNRSAALSPTTTGWSPYQTPAIPSWSTNRRPNRRRRRRPNAAGRPLARRLKSTELWPSSNCYLHPFRSDEFRHLQKSWREWHGRRHFDRFRSCSRRLLAQPQNIATAINTIVHDDGQDRHSLYVKSNIDQTWTIHRHYPVGQDRADRHDLD